MLTAAGAALLMAAPAVTAYGAVARAAAPAAEEIDLEVVHRIKDEGFLRSQVMDHLYALTDANGPRVTGSPGFKSAADWSVKALKHWGLADPRLESWGRFGRGWDVVRFRAEMTAPAYAVLRGVPRAWSGSTSGPARGEVILAPFAPTCRATAPRWTPTPRNGAGSCAAASCSPIRCASSTCRSSRRCAGSTPTGWPACSPHLTRARSRRSNGRSTGCRPTRRRGAP
jgi:hypothetical protein